MFAIYGQHPGSDVELSAPLANPSVPASVHFDRLDAEELVEKFRKIDKFLIENIKLHSAEHEIQANKSRVAARDFQPGDQVWLNFKNIKSLRPTPRLEYKNRGPFKIIEAVGQYAFKPQLAKHMKIYSVIHVSFLSSVSFDLLPGKSEGAPPPFEAVDDDKDT